MPIKCYDIITTTPGKPQTWDIYDVMGRKTVATHESYGGPSSRWVYVYQVTEYDRKGNVANKTTPVNGTDWADREYTYFQYDYLNRLTSENNPTLGTTSYGYTYPGAGQSTVTVTTPAGQVSSKTTDATGKVVSTTDHGGTLTFDYDNRGNQKSVKMNGTVVTSMIYDRRGFQTSMTDPNSETTQYLYDNYGQLKWQKDARNSEYTMNYDNLGRLTTRTGPEGTTTNEYVTSGNGLNALKKVTSFNGILQEYTYDNWHRLATTKETIDATAYTKTFTYNDFNDLETTTYPSGLVTTNTYSGDGYLIGVTANNGQVLFNGANGDMSGQGKWRNYRLGNGVTSNITYNHFGMPTLYRAGNNQAANNVQNLELNWNLQTGNLNSRVDNVKVKTENFTYDNLNRLRTANVNGLQSYSFDFADNGNPTFKSDAGTYVDDGSKPNAVSDVGWNVFYGNSISGATQNVVYTKFQQPEKITEGAYELSFTYASDYERRKTELKQNGTIVNTRLFMGDYEMDVKDGTERYIHYISGGDGLCAIVVQDAQSGDFQSFFPYTDHLGSILTLTMDEGSVAAEQNFDAWGRKRNVSTWDYANVGTVPTWLYRGFTGHEHLPEFGLINMNARLYDAVLGRMLSPDNYVGAGTQGLNRYSYANNNPLNSIDPDGNNPIILVGALVGGLVNLGVKAYNGQINSVWDGVVAFGIGAVGGAITAATGGAAAGAFGLGTTGVASGIVTGGVGAAFGSPVTGVGNSLYFNDPSYSFDQYGKDILMGAALGGVISGGVAAWKGQNIWWGNTPLVTRVGVEMTRQSLSWSQRGYVEQISQAELADLASKGIKPSIAQAGGVATSSQEILGPILPGDWTKVGRWMSKIEYEKMQGSGLTQQNSAGVTDMSVNGWKDFYRQAPRGSVYVHFEVPTNSLGQGGNVGWIRAYGPNASSLKSNILNRGGMLSPHFRNLSTILRVK